jgi:phosphohistidine phosphatase
MLAGMLTLCLLRHGKSSWDDASIQDFDRPLAPRGEEAAPRMGAYMAAQGIEPELILCSPAARARQTLALVLPKLAGQPSVEFEDGLYLASSSALLARIRKVRANTHRLMIVGHDPGMHGLAVELSGRGSTEDLNRLANKFPTAGLAVITFRLTQWSQVKPKAGRLDLFMAPRRLS